MSDLQKYLKTEYRDAEYREYELNQWKGFGDRFWWTAVLSAGALCFFIMNFLYLRP